MRSASPTARSARFLGVRLSAEEDGKLEEFRRQQNLANRSEAIRSLVRGTSEARPGSVELPQTLQGELLGLVEDGYVRSVEEGITLLLTLGMSELGRIHAERASALRHHARNVAARRESRRQADREGRDLLGQ